MANAPLHEHDAFAPSHGASACRGYEASTAPAPTFQPGRLHKVRAMGCAEEVAVLKQAVGPRLGGADRLAFVETLSRQGDRWLRCQFIPARPD